MILLLLSIYHSERDNQYVVWIQMFFLHVNLEWNHIHQIDHCDNQSRRVESPHVPMQQHTTRKEQYLTLLDLHPDMP